MPVVATPSTRSSMEEAMWAAEDVARMALAIATRRRPSEARMSLSPTMRPLAEPLVLVTVVRTLLGGRCKSTLSRRHGRGYRLTNRALSRFLFCHFGGGAEAVSPVVPACSCTTSSSQPRGRG